MNLYAIHFQPPRAEASAETAELEASSVVDAIDLFVQYTVGDPCWQGSNILGVSVVETACPLCSRKYAVHDTYCMYCGHVRYQGRKGY